MAKHSTSRLRALSRGLRSTPVRAVLSLGVVVGFGAVGTLAYWTDSITAPGGTFTAGKLDIKLDGSNDPPATFTSSFKSGAMVPGDTKAASVVVNNAGTIPFVYSGTGTAPGDLAPSMKFRVVIGGTVSGTGNSQSCTGGTETFALGVLDGTDKTVLPSRSLAVGASETFCVEATIPTGTTTGQGLSTTAGFTFNAKQVGAP